MTDSPGSWLVTTSRKLIKGGLVGEATVPTAAFSPKRYLIGSLKCKHITPCPYCVAQAPTPPHEYQGQLLLTVW